MAANEAPELFGDGEGDHEVVSGELPLHLICQPLMGFVVLTVGAMPISA